MSLVSVDACRNSVLSSKTAYITANKCGKQIMGKQNMGKYKKPSLGNDHTWQRSVVRNIKWLHLTISTGRRKGV